MRSKAHPTTSSRDGILKPVRSHTCTCTQVSPDRPATQRQPKTSGRAACVVQSTQEPQIYFIYSDTRPAHREVLDFRPERAAPTPSLALVDEPAVATLSTPPSLLQIILFYAHYKRAACKIVGRPSHVASEPWTFGPRGGGWCRSRGYCDSAALMRSLPRP